MPKKYNNIVEAAVMSTLKRKLRNAKYKAMDSVCPGLRPMLRIQRAMKTLQKTLPKANI